MARGAKKEIMLTPEEKLARALVPETEQPYRVPENWRWVRLGGITEVVGGGTPSSDVKEYYENGNISWISPADLSNYSKNISLLLPSVDEQLEIVRILENLFAKEKHTKEAAEQVIDQIDTMKKAILARAFRGELGTNDPVEESVERLLKQILFKGVR